MAQIFPRASNSIARFALGGAVVLSMTIGVGVFGIYRSSYSTQVGISLDQPVPFSHEHHVQVLGIDCRFCHLHVEESSTAGVPATEICMKCHSQLWTNAELLEPVRQSFLREEPIRWNRVHRLPDHVFFNHSIHVQKGIGCSTCHGRVDKMPLIAKAESLHMQWCLECHRDPKEFLRPAEEVFAMGESSAERSEEERLALLAHYNIETKGLTDCVACHR